MTDSAFPESSMLTSRGCLPAEWRPFDRDCLTSGELIQFLAAENPTLRDVSGSIGASCFCDGDRCNELTIEIVDLGKHKKRVLFTSKSISVSWCRWCWKTFVGHDFKYLKIVYLYEISLLFHWGNFEFISSTTIKSKFVSNYICISN